MLAADNNCQPITIQGWKPEWNRANCAEVVVPVKPLGVKTGEDAPRCGNEKDLTNAKQVQEAIGKATAAAGAGVGAKVGAAVGGPVGVVVGPLVGAAAATGIGAVIKNNYKVDFAMCTDACVHLPVKATNILVQGWSGPMPHDHGGTPICDMTDPNMPGRCDWARKGNWLAMSIPTNASDPTTGQVYCSVAKNWSEDTEGQLGLRVMYDLAP